MSTAQPPTVVDVRADSADWLALQVRLADLALGQSGAAAAATHGTQARHLAFLPPEALELDLTDPLQREFGDYELLDKLGQGGMGVVYRARQRSLDREVALKLLAAGPWASRDFIERFRREAQSAARMQHPNIVSIFEVGARDELNYFSMALVRGESLASLLARQGPQSPQRAAALMRTVAEAVDYAHRLGVLHLDLKPGNVLVDERGEPQVADFGLARRLDDTLAADSDEVSGTPSYMAPEQATLKTRRLTPATDVYGLGAILYEMLVGRPPFLGPTPQETLKRVVGLAPERPRAQRREVPPDLEAICLKCLEKDAARRYPSARALVADLGAFLDGRPVSVRPLSAPQRLLRAARREPRLAVAIGAVVLALAGGLGATALQWRRADANAATAQERTWVLRAQAAQATLAVGDGFRGLRDLVTNLAEMEAAGRADRAALERQRIGTLLANAPRLVDLQRVEQGMAIHALAFAPDGRTLVAALHGARGSRAIRAFDVATGAVRWTTDTGGWTPALPWAGQWHGWLRWSADGSRVLATMPNQTPFPFPRVADSMPLDARTGTLLVPPFADETFYDIVASDDARIALARWREDRSHRFPDSGQFFRIDGWVPFGPRHRFVADLQTDSWLPTPDGSAWLGTGGSSHVRLHEVGSLEVRWTHDLPAGDLLRGWRFSGDGRHLALGTAEGRVFLLDPRDGSATELHASPTAAVRWLEFDREGRTLAVRADNGMVAAWDVATRLPRIAPLAGPAGESGALRLEADTVYLTAGAEVGIHALPPRAGFDNVALPAPVRVRNRRAIAAHATDVHAGSRLLAVGGADGTVGLWREAPLPIRAARAALLPTHSLHFDGTSLVAVEGRRVQLRGVFDERPLSAPFEFPDPVRLAERSADGTRLAVVSGRTLRVLDPSAGALVGAPIVLPESPLRAEIAGAAPVLLLTTGELDAGRFVERLHVVDLARGTLREDDATAAGPITLLRLDAQGMRVLLATRDLRSRAQQLAVRGLGGVPGCGAPMVADINAVIDAAFTPDGRRLWVLASLAERRSALVRIDLERCTEDLRVPLQQGATTPRLRADGDGVVLHRQSGDLLSRFDARGVRHDVPGMVGAMPLGHFALDREGRRAVLAARNGVQLVDLARGDVLSGVLSAPISPDDGIMQLALSPRADAVLARTLSGRWLAWPLASTARDVGELSRLATLLEPRNADPPLDDEAFADVRARLRAHDVAPVTIETDPPPIAFEADPLAADDPRFVPLDLSPAVNVPLHGGWPRRVVMTGDTPTLPAGPQRLAGIDWRVDGGVQLSWGQAAATLHPTQRASALVPVAGIAARRVHLLMLVHIPIDHRKERSRAATVALLDVAGRRTELEVQMVRDVVTQSLPEFADPSARIGWIGVSGRDLRAGASAGETSMFVYAVSLDVPPGTPPVQGLVLETRDGPMEAPLFYAVTLERAPLAAPVP